MNKILPLIKLRFVGLLCTYISISVFTGCAITFQDRNDVVHLIGFGHMKMKVPDAKEGVQAVMYGTETLGLTVGKTSAGHHVSAGWQRIEQLNIVDEDTSIRIEKPKSKFFMIEVGTLPPHTLIQKK